MSRVVRVEPNGSMREEIIKQEDIHKLIKGRLEFVGAIDKLQAFIVGTVDGEEDENRVLTLEAPARGAVFVIGSGPNGEETDLCLHALRSHLDSQRGV